MSSRRSTHSSKGELDVAIIDDWTLNVSGLLDQLDHDLEQAKMGSGRIESVVAALKLASQKVITPTLSVPRFSSQSFGQRGAEVTALQQKLNAVSARNDLDKSQISDLQSELEAVYEVSVLHLAYSIMPDLYAHRLSTSSLTECSPMQTCRPPRHLRLSGEICKILKLKGMTYVWIICENDVQLFLSHPLLTTILK
jgi:cell division protein FtsB